MTSTETNGTDARREDPELPGLDRDQQLPSGPQEITATRELAEVERAVAAGGGTPREREVLEQVDRMRHADARRDEWRRLTDTA